MIMARKRKTFKEAVDETPDLTNSYKFGLQAFGRHSEKIIVQETNRIDGSVNIDEVTKSKYPQESRWDYMFSYKNEVYFVEIHSAKTSEVKTVLKKLEWLKNWLNSKAKSVDSLKAKKPYHWIYSKKFDILSSSSQARLLSQNGLSLPKKELKL